MWSSSSETPTLMSEASPTHLVPRCNANAPGAVRLPLIGGPHCGYELVCSRDDVKVGQYEVLSGHPRGPVPPVYAPCAFYVVQEHEGSIECVYAPHFNPDRDETVMAGG